jgi:hypothetical protein
MAAQMLAHGEAGLPTTDEGVYCFSRLAFPLVKRSASADQNTGETKVPKPRNT